VRRRGGVRRGGGVRRRGDVRRRGGVRRGGVRRKGGGGEGGVSPFSGAGLAFTRGGAAREVELHRGQTREGPDA